jgi:hypothetical protein
MQRVKELCAPWLFAPPPLVEPEELAGLFGRELERLDLCELLDLYWEWYAPKRESVVVCGRIVCVCVCVCLCVCVVCSSVTECVYM